MAFPRRAVGHRATDAAINVVRDYPCAIVLLRVAEALYLLRSIDSRSADVEFSAVSIVLLSVC